MKPSEIVRILVRRIIPTIVLIIIAVLAVWLGWPVFFEFCGRDHLVAATWVMALFTTILAVFTIIQGYATWGHLKAFREVQTWDRLRKHSEKLKPALLEWLEKVSVSPGRMETRYGDVAYATLERPSHKYFRALWEHIETGYKNDARIWETLEHKFKVHTENAKKFFRMLEEKVKQRVHLPTYSSKDKPPEEWFNSYRCAEIVYSILTGRLDANYYLEDNPPKIKQSKSGYHEMSWNSIAIAIISNETERIFIEQAITDLIKDPKMVNEGNRLTETAQHITELLSSFRNELGTLIGVIELGGILDGDCEYCRRIKLR